MKAFARGSARGWAVPLLLIGAACAPEAESGAAEPAVDVAAVDLQIGAIDGTGPNVFSRITGLATDDEGRIFVADYASSQIRVFDRVGSHLFTFGGEGSGPAELNGPCCLAWGPDGLLWVRDGGNARYTAFSVRTDGADYVEMRRMAHSDANYFVPIRFSSSGELIDVGHQASGEGESRITLFTLSQASDVIRTAAISNPPPEELGMLVVRQPGMTRYLYRPFPPLHLVAFGPRGDLATAIGSRYAIEWVQGSDTVIVEGTAESPPLTASERVDAEEDLVETAQRAGMGVNELPFGVPDVKPPLRAITFDEADRLWVHLSPAEGEPQLADLWSSQGELVKRVQWPADVSLRMPAALSQTSAIAVRRDSLGVESVVRLRY